MRAALAALLLLPGAALAQGLATGGGCSAAGATCTGTTWTLSTGATFQPSTDNNVSLGAAAKRFAALFALALKDGESTSRLTLATDAGNTYVSDIADGGSAIAHLLNSNAALANAAAKLLSLQNNSVEKAYFLGSGALVIDGVASGSNSITVPAGSSILFGGGTTAKASATTSGLLLNSGVTNSGTNVAYVLDSTNSISGTTLLLSLRNSTAEKLFVTDDGITNTAKYYQSSEGYGPGSNSPLSQGVAFSGSNTTINVSADGSTIKFAAASGLDFGRITQNGFFTTSSTNPVPVVHAAQTTSAQAMEFGKTAATGGALAVTFATAFASAPTCTCTGTNATPAGCVISTAANTTTVTFTFGAGTDVINWICIGAK